MCLKFIKNINKMINKVDRVSEEKIQRDARRQNEIAQLCIKSITQVPEKPESDKSKQRRFTDNMILI